MSAPHHGKAKWNGAVAAGSVLSVLARFAHGIASWPQDARYVRQGRSDLQDSSLNRVSA